MITFTDSQKFACDISRNIAITAGAGSGKTSVLVERFLWCLQNNDYQVRRIVAITFTDKAAGEMLGRIRKAVLDRISGQLGDPRRWEDVLEKLPLAPISTIHGFCQRLLREFPIESGVDPNFDVFDEAVMQIRLIHLIDHTLRELSASCNESLRVLSEFWSPTALRDILRQLIESRDKSLPWAQQIRQTNVSEYLQHLFLLAKSLQQRGVERLATHPQWQNAIAEIRAVMPDGDSSKLTLRCRSILEFDAEFRQQTTLDDRLTTLGMIKKQCSMIGVTKTWKEDGRDARLKGAFQRLKELYDGHLPEYAVNEDLEQSGFHAQQALAEMFLTVYAAYQQEKAARRVLDFDDLQERALLLLKRPDIQPLLARRYDYVMVDEFQDTNDIQWQIIGKLGAASDGLAKDKFCIVGDEKQSIYKFRGAEVAVFADVRRKLTQANLRHNLVAIEPKIPPMGEKPDARNQPLSGELIMAENFRSSKPLIFFFNYLFSRLFLREIDTARPYDVPHQELVFRKLREQSVGENSQETADSSVEFLLINQTAPTAANAVTDEAELVALRIRELAGKHVPFRHIAILLRARTRLKEFENALRRYDIPFIVAGGIGFFQQQEIYDLTNLLRVLVDTWQDVALTGVLRSPFFSLTDDQLLYLAEDGNRVQSRSSTENPTRTLWEKLERRAQSVEMHNDIIPAELNAWKFLHVWKLLQFWKMQADRIPITHLLRQMLDDTGMYGIFAGDRRETQAITNIEKFLDMARNFENEGFQALSDFVSYIDQLTEIEGRESEAQLNTEGMNVVQIMTIHAAKGLEFPVVFLPELERQFNYGADDAVYLDRLPSNNRDMAAFTIAAGIKGRDPQQDYTAQPTILREYLRGLNKEKVDAEMKRLLYVGCTRAEKMLIFSGTFADKIAKNSWLAWLSEILPLKDGLIQHFLSIAEASSGASEPFGLSIPIRTPLNYLDNAIQPSDAAPRTVDVNQFEAQLFAEPPVENFTKLNDNLRPLTGSENELFRINPSTLHLLLICPRRYYYQTALRLNPSEIAEYAEHIAVDNAEPLAPPSFAAERGTIIHALFEQQIFDRYISDENCADAVDRFLSERRISPDDRQRMRLDTAINAARRNYLSSGLKERLAAASQVYREYPFRLRFGQMNISGVIDALFLDPVTRCWTILDYKSNEIDSSQVTAEISRHGYDLQMQLYALAVSRLLNVAPVQCILFFTFPGCRYETIDLSPNALDHVVNKIHLALARLSTGDFPALEDREICETCEFRLTGICL